MVSIHVARAIKSLIAPKQKYKNKVANLRKSVSFTVNLRLSTLYYNIDCQLLIDYNTSSSTNVHFILVRPIPSTLNSALK